MNAKKLAEMTDNVAEIREIAVKNLITGRWVRMKCMYGCSFYGKSLSCPPEVPRLKECIKAIKGYKHAFFIRFECSKMEDCNRSIIQIERALFKEGFYKAFGFFVTPCRAKNRLKCRPTAESYGIDLIGTARRLGMDMSGYFGVVLVD